MYLSIMFINNYVFILIRHASQSSQPANKHVVDSLAHRDSIAETTVVKVNRNRNGN